MLPRHKGINNSYSTIIPTHLRSWLHNYHNTTHMKPIPYNAKIKENTTNRYWPKYLWQYRWKSYHIVSTNTRPLTPPTNPESRTKAQCKYPADIGFNLGHSGWKVFVLGKYCLFEQIGHMHMYAFCVNILFSPALCVMDLHIHSTHNVSINIYTTSLLYSDD